MQSLRQFDEHQPQPDDTKVYFNFDEPSWNDWLYSEGFTHITQRTEDSYGFTTYYPHMISNYLYRNNYWYWSQCLGCFIFRIYIFRNCIIIDKDWDCGGNAGGLCFDTSTFTIQEIWNEIIEYIKTNIN